MVNTEEQTINADQVVWIYATLDRYIEIITNLNAVCPGSGNPGIGRIRKATKLACLLEIMAIIDHKFSDDSAIYNAIVDLPEIVSKNLNKDIS